MEEKHGRTFSSKPRSHHVASTICAVVLFFSLTIGVSAQWARMTVFDSARFAQRASAMLDSDAVRTALADEITVTIINSGPSSLASFQTVIRSAVDPLLQTPTFRRLFRRALDTAHDYLFTQSGNSAVINLSQALVALTGSLQVTNPDVASILPDGSQQLLIDIGDNVRNHELWRITERLTLLGVGLLVLSVFLGAGVIFLDPDRRRGTFRLGAMVALSGGAMFAIALVVPPIAASFTPNVELAKATTVATALFVSDYRALAIWFVILGSILAAFSTMRAALGERVTIRGTWSRLEQIALDHRPRTRRGRIAGAVALIAIGLTMIAENDVIVPLLVAMIGAVVAFVGASHLLAMVGRTETTDPSGAVIRIHSAPRWPSIVTVSTLLLIVAIGGVVSVSRSNANASSALVQTCNGYAQLCERRLDEVAFLGSHNSMSTSTDPGWLFFEQNRSIPSQLDLGVRALLMKTHYGIPTNVNVTGAPLVVTDTVAEVNIGSEPGDESFSSDQRARAQQLKNSVNIDPKERDVYLCHVYCEYGATKFSTALGYVRQFLTSNPDNVIILVLGDYVSRDDTLKAFRTARLEDRMYEFDPNGPTPTLGQLIDSGRNVIMMSEFSGPPPAWNIRAYGQGGMLQDTPFTFARDADLFTPGSPRYTGTAIVNGPVSDTVAGPDGTEVWAKDWIGIPSCAPNRGTPSSPLFQVNHWVTPAGAAPTIDEAKVVNAYDVLMPRVTDCRTQRGRFPNIIGVNFVGAGDALRVVDELNGVR